MVTGSHAVALPLTTDLARESYMLEAYLPCRPDRPALDELGLQRIEVEIPTGKGLGRPGQPPTHPGPPARGGALTKKRFPFSRTEFRRSPPPNATNLTSCPAMPLS